MAFKYRPSKADAQLYAQKMAEITEFCDAHGIRSSLSSDSYYFEIDGQKYRVSNHTVSASNRGAYDDFGNKVRDEYHPDGEAEMICFTASKTRIIDIYNDITAGYKLDRRGRRVN